MKKILTIGLALILALSLLTACGKNDNGENNSAVSSQPSESGKGTKDPAQLLENAIKSSELVTLEDAERITGMKMDVDGEIDVIGIGTVTHPRESIGVMSTKYVSDDNNNLQFRISIQQSVVMEYQKLKFPEWDYNYVEGEGGVPYLIGDWKRIIDIGGGGNDTTPIEGLGDWAYYSPVLNTVYIALGDYFIKVSADYKSLIHPMTSEQKKALDSLIKKTVTEAGNLALERLETLIK